jgi:protein involved in polysaccharide export with SLBB domain
MHPVDIPTSLPAVAERTLDFRRPAFAQRLPLVAGILLLYGHVGLFCRATLSHTDGHFSYPLDDTFIHMAIARNLAAHGVFGVTSHAFAAASSSILWPLVLAAVDIVAGDHLLTPLLINLALAGALVAFVDVQIAKGVPHASPLWRGLVVVALVALTPLPTVAFLGMEHSAHIFASVLLVASAGAWLAGSGEGAPGGLLVLAAIVTSLRYEGVFLVGVLAGLAVLRRRVRAAALFVAAGAIPIVLFGAYSAAHGGLLVPNSVLLKGNRVHFHEMSDAVDFFALELARRAGGAPHMLAALIGGFAMMLAAIRYEGRWGIHGIRIGVSTLVGVAHVQLASIGWFYRYESYVVALIVTNVGLFVLDAGPRYFAGSETKALAKAAAAVSAFIGIGPLMLRSADAASATPSASRNIYDQQVQTARFLAQYFPDEPAAVNDIGAVAYFGRQPIVDLGGLATLEAAREKRFEMMRPLPADVVDRLTAHSSVAVVYDEWVSERPSSWVLLGQWSVGRCASCYSPVVSVYATRPEALPRVMDALRSFTPALPRDVATEGLYVDLPPAVSPTAPDYALSEGDTLLLRVRGLEKEDFSATIGSDGRLPLPRADRVLVRGARVADVPALVAAAYAASEDRQRPLDVGVPSVRLIEARWTRVVVAGNAHRTGERWWSEPPTMETVLAKAGGRTDRTSGAPIYVYRRRGASYERIEMASTDFVRSLDVVVVP